MPRAFQPPYATQHVLPHWKLLTCRSEAAQGLTLPCIFLCLPHRAVFSCFSYVWPFETPWTVAHQALLSLGFSRQEFWSGLLCPPPGDLPDPGIEPTSPVSPALQADSLPLSFPGNPFISYMTSEVLGKWLENACWLWGGRVWKSPEVIAPREEPVLTNESDPFSPYNPSTGYFYNIKYMYFKFFFPQAVLVNLNASLRPWFDISYF